MTNHESAKLNQQEFTVDTGRQTGLDAYHRELIQNIAASAERVSTLNRELQRQQTLLQAAMTLEITKNNDLAAEQQDLNRLEEQSRKALLEYISAKQHIDRIMQDYNHQLEKVKLLRSQQDNDSAALAEQKQHIRSLMHEWQQQNFFLQKQQHLNQEVESRIAAGSTQDVTGLPPLQELQPPQPKPAQPTAKTPHANAGFWDSKQHTSLNLDKLKQEPPGETPTEATATPDKRKSIGSIILSYAVCIALAIAVAFAIRTWVVVPTHVSGSSMQPTLHSDDKILTSPLPYIFGEPKRGDIIVFPAPDTAEEESIYYVKRVIALPGDHLQIIDGSVYINDELLQEDYLTDPYTGGYIDTLVPEDSLFVMGDNRQVSHDSRDANVSFISIDDIRGQALWRIYPLEDIGSLY